ARLRPLGPTSARPAFPAGPAPLGAPLAIAAPSFAAVSRFSAFVMLSSFALVAHDDSSLCRRPNASEIFASLSAAAPGEGLAMPNCRQYASHFCLFPPRLTNALQPRP